MRDQLHRQIVDAIIGDIRAVYTSDPEDLGDIEPISDEEMAELDAEYEAYRASLTPEERDEQDARNEAWAKDFGAWCRYAVGMRMRNEPFYDYYEWRNMRVKPTVPEDGPA